MLHGAFAHSCTTHPDVLLAVLGLNFRQRSGSRFKSIFQLGSNVVAVSRKCKSGIHFEQFNDNDCCISVGI